MKVDAEELERITRILEEYLLCDHISENEKEEFFRDLHARLTERKE